MTLQIYVDADACPVKDEVLRVAARHQVKVTMVANFGLRPSRDPMVAHVMVPQGADAADDWIVEHVAAGGHSSIALKAFSPRTSPPETFVRQEANRLRSARAEPASARDGREPRAQCGIYEQGQERVFAGAGCGGG